MAGQSTPRDSSTSDKPSPNSILVFDFEAGFVGGGLATGVLHTPEPGSPGRGRREGERMEANKASSSSVRTPGASCRKM